MNASLCDSAPWGIIKSCVKPVRVDRKCLKIKTVFFALMYEFTEKENTSFLLLRRSLSLAFVAIFFHEMMYGPYSILSDMFFSLPKDPAAMPMN